MLTFVSLPAGPATITLHPSRLHLQIYPGATAAQKQTAIETFYRQILKETIPPIITEWEARMNVSVRGVTIRKMKTKWGSCSPDRGTIRLNLELAKQPLKYLEYVIIHEMTHLLEPTHNKTFIQHMNTFLPQWKSYRQDLNLRPIP